MKRLKNKIRISTGRPFRSFRREILFGIITIYYYSPVNSNTNEIYNLKGNARGRFFVQIHFLQGSFS